MYTVPSTNIRILKGVKIDMNYENTLYFPSVEEQIEYFKSKTKHNLDNYSHERIDNDNLYVEINISELYDCNYVMLQNEGSEKWFYGFITNLVYVNNNVTQITYELDVMQTFLYDYDMTQCMVERNHVAIDGFYATKTPEPFNISDYETKKATNVSSTIADITHINLIAINTTFFKNKTNGMMLNGIYSGTSVILFKDFVKANEFIKQVTDAGKADGIVSIYMLPSWVAFKDGFVPQFDEYYILEESNYNVSNEITMNDNIDVIATKVWGGYKPKNKKLYNYPFLMVEILNGMGDSMELEIERFTDGEMNFVVESSMVNPVTAILSPMNYRTAGKNIDEYRLKITGFPQSSYNIDVYKAWLAQQARPETYSIRDKTLITAGLGALASTFLPVSLPFVVTGGVMSVIGSVASLVGQNHKESIKPSKAVGGGGSNNVLFANQEMNFFFRYKFIHKDKVKIIDDFFTMYGYSVNQIIKPSRYNRKRFTYLKTADFQCVGSLPSNYGKAISNIYNKGIRFWRDYEGVGNYDSNELLDENEGEVI